MTEIRDDASVLLPLAWQSPQHFRTTRIALEAALDALLAIGSPFSASFVMSAGGDEPPRAGWAVTAVDAASTTQYARDVSDILSAAVAWQGLGEPSELAVDCEEANWFALVVEEGTAGRSITNARSIPWELARSRDHRTTMWIDLVGSRVGDGGAVAVECRVTVNGDGQSAADIAALLAADPPGPVRLVATPIADRLSAPTVTMPLRMLAHLVGSPARMPDAWPSAEPNRLPDLLERIDETVPPHVTVFGGTGQGKTTLLEHMMLDSARSGVPRAVLCAHGDLAERAVPIAMDQDADFVFLDFGSETAPATWNITIPPPGVEPRTWAMTLVTVLKESFPVRNEEWFGPVGNKSLRVACELLVRDLRDGIPEPITRLADVLAADGGRREWVHALERVGDDRLSRELREVWGMIDNDRHSHTGLWLSSKVERFVADPGVVRVLGQRTSSVDPSVLAAGTTLIASAPASCLGDQGSNLILGALLAQIWHHLRARDRGQATTVDVFVDEVQRFAPDHLVTMLAESRKHGVRLRLATQTPNNLDPGLRDSVLSNCGAVSTFRVGTRDAHALEPLFPLSAVAALTQTPRHWVTTSFGDTETLTRSEPPLEW